MCGISAIFSSDKELIKKIENITSDSISTISKRGPDATNKISKGDSILIHTHLQITGNCSQPVLNENIVLLFNGEIYNDYKNYNLEYSDTHFLINQLGKYQENAFEILDGEFAICYRNFDSEKLFLATDPFGTKPLYYQLGKNFLIVGSYDTTVKKYNQNGEIVRVTPNTLLEFDIKNFKLINSKILKPFDFTNQINESFEEWNMSFKNSILKRTSNISKTCFIPISAGHDSGLFAAEMIAQKIPFYAYTIPYKENSEILNARLELFKKNNVPYSVFNPTENEYKEIQKYLHENCEPYQLINEDSDTQLFSDSDVRNNTGFNGLAYIFKDARKNQRLICLSGQGGDEIFSDYSNIHTNMRESELKGNWNNITKPWKNFYGGYNKMLLGGIERIAGCFGIETRYPLLDYNVVQEFLNLEPKLKSKFYKSPLTNRLSELHFPFHMKKDGFNAGDPSIFQSYKNIYTR